jgi:hypothetical protein
MNDGILSIEKNDIYSRIQALDYSLSEIEKDLVTCQQQIANLTLCLNILLRILSNNISLKINIENIAKEWSGNNSHFNINEVIRVFEGGLHNMEAL